MARAAAQYARGLALTNIGRSGNCARTTSLRSRVTVTATAKATFVPITPQRVLDTRNGTGGYNAPLGSTEEARLLFGPPPCCAGEILTDQIPFWWVSAVVMNVTVTQPTWDGSLVVYPSGTTPPLASNLNFNIATTVPNLVIAKLGTDRSMRVRNNATQGTVHVIVDISGYFNS